MIGVKMWYSVILNEKKKRRRGKIIKELARSVSRCSKEKATIPNASVKQEALK